MVPGISIFILFPTVPGHGLCAKQQKQQLFGCVRQRYNESCRGKCLKRLSSRHPVLCARRTLQKYPTDYQFITIK
jgi:hypothetical protein